MDINYIIENGKELVDEMKRDNHHRDKSWEHCYSVFEKYKGKEPDDYEKDHLCLHLAFYLASFGMYRGSSFLFNKDYKVHSDAVNEIFKLEYKSLWAVKCKDYSDSLLAELTSLTGSLRKIYEKKRKSVKGRETVKSDISDILITKILLGTLGCVPAFDEYFKKCARKAFNQKFAARIEENVKSIAKYYDDYNDDFEKLRTAIFNETSIDYPQMRILDMCFCTTGYKINKNKGGAK